MVAQKSLIMCCVLSSQLINFSLSFVTLDSLPVGYTALKNDMLNVVYFNKIKYKSSSVGDFQWNFKFASQVIFKFSAHANLFFLCGLEILLNDLFLISSCWVQMKVDNLNVRQHNILPREMWLGKMFDIWARAGKCLSLFPAVTNWKACVHMSKAQSWDDLDHWLITCAGATLECCRH